MKVKIRKNLFETNSSSAHTVTYASSEEKYNIPDMITIDIADFDYCGDTVKGWQNKANYLWEIITQSSGNYIYAMRFIEFLAELNIKLRFSRNLIDDNNWYDGHLPYDSEGEDLLKEFLFSKLSLQEFLFNDDLIVELHEG